MCCLWWQGSVACCTASRRLQLCVWDQRYAKWATFINVCRGALLALSLIFCSMVTSCSLAQSQYWIIIYYSGVAGRRTHINACQSSPCLNGYCYIFHDSYVCHCFDGFSGANCEVQVSTLGNKKKLYFRFVGFAAVITDTPRICMTRECLCNFA